MNPAENPYKATQWGVTVDQAPANERVDFIRKTYLHLLGAVLAFCGLSYLLYQADVGENVARFINARGQMAWLGVIVAFMAVSWVADSWARSGSSMGMQYAGLGLYVVAWSLIFSPLLYIAADFGGPNVIPTAATITLLMFAALTAAVFITGHDFSFLRTALMVGGFAAIGLIVCGSLFGFQLGNLFIIAMIVLACGYILYDTSNVMHKYQVGQHVAASLALFSSVAFLFWYVLQLVMSRE